MKIRFTDSVAGANFAYQRDEVHDLRPDIAKEFLRAKQAVKVEEEHAADGDGLIAGLARRVRRGAKTAEIAVGGAPENRS